MLSTLTMFINAQRGRTGATGGRKSIPSQAVDMSFIHFACRRCDFHDYRLECGTYNVCRIKKYLQHVINVNVAIHVTQIPIFIITHRRERNETGLSNILITLHFHFLSYEFEM